MKAGTALITGGANGIGNATASLLIERGWRVAILDRDVEPAREQAAAHPDQLLLIGMDVATSDAAEVACDQVVERWGGLDLLVPCAGINRYAPFEDLSPDDWSAVLNVNLTATFRFMQAAARHMLKAGGGAMVNISSIAGARGNPDRCAYSATKAAVDSLTKSGAIGWATRGIRVNAVAPGFTQTAMVQTHIDAGRVNVEQFHSVTPMRRMATPEEIAKVVVFLASDEASFITGQTIYVDGGFMAEYGVPSTVSTAN